MRSALLLPLALAAAAAAGCGRSVPDGTEQAEIRLPPRDLTLREVAAPKAEVASPVELARATPPRSTTHRAQHARRSAPASNPKAAEPGDVPAIHVATPAPARAVSAPVTRAAAEPPDPHALAPGQTVTIIPATTSPSEGGWNDQSPAEEGRGVIGSGGQPGGRCKPHRPGGVPRRIAGGAFR